MAFNRRDLISGVLVAATGVFACVYSAYNLRIGQAVAMGPGYFPILLGLLLIAFGAAIVFLSPADADGDLGPVAWRGIVLVIGAILFFAFTVRPLGLAPALFGATFLATIANKDASMTLAVVVSVFLTAFNIGVFVYALGLPYPLLGPFLGA